MSEHSPFEARGDFINGVFTVPTDPCAEIALEDPGDLDALSGGFPCSAQSVEHAVEAARGAFPAWRDASAADRASCLERFAEQLEAESESLAMLISREVGKPLWEARGEVKAMVGKVAITLQEGLEPIRERSFENSPGQLARWRAQPRGVLAMLGPFNFPGHLVHGHVVPALRLFFESLPAYLAPDS